MPCISFHEEIIRNRDEIEGKIYGVASMSEKFNIIRYFLSNTSVSCV